MRAITLLAFLLIAYTSPSLAALGGSLEQFDSDGTPVTASTSSAVSNYVLHDTTLTSGTHVREYVSGNGVVFAIVWAGPVLPNLKALLGSYFNMMVNESRRKPRPGNSHMAVNRTDVVINSGGHMRDFEGSAWIPADFPDGFTADNVH